MRERRKGEKEQGKEKKGGVGKNKKRGKGCWSNEEGFALTFFFFLSSQALSQPKPDTW
jgi:hypothetical protein